MRLSSHSCPRGCRCRSRYGCVRAGWSKDWAVRDATRVPWVGPLYPALKIRRAGLATRARQDTPMIINCDVGDPDGRAWDVSSKMRGAAGAATERPYWEGLAVSAASAPQAARKPGTPMERVRILSVVNYFRVRRPRVRSSAASTAASTRLLIFGPDTSIKAATAFDVVIGWWLAKASWFFSTEPRS
jgi:hypothetical protein